MKVCHCTLPNHDPSACSRCSNNFDRVDDWMVHPYVNPTPSYTHAYKLYLEELKRLLHIDDSVDTSEFNTFVLGEWVTPIDNKTD